VWVSHRGNRENSVSALQCWQIPPKVPEGSGLRGMTSIGIGWPGAYMIIACWFRTGEQRRTGQKNYLLFLTGQIIRIVCYLPYHLIQQPGRSFDMADDGQVFGIGDRAVE
jgi:hypothetical protein